MLPQPQSDDRVLFYFNPRRIPTGTILHTQIFQFLLIFTGCSPELTFGVPDFPRRAAAGDWETCPVQSKGFKRLLNL